MNLLKKPFAYAIIFGFFLASLFSYSLLKTFVLSQAMTSVQSKSTTATSKLSSGQTEQTENSYKDDHLNITLIEKTVENTQVYIADIQTDSADFLKTALANHTYGTNVTAKTSETAAANKAILAVNGDYYGANADGYVIRDGQIYRDSVRQNADNGDLAIYKDGSFKIINENEVTAQELVDQGVVNLLAFGPALIKDGDLAVGTNSEVGQSMASNPRTAIGIIDQNHYIIIVSDGRTSESQGLSLYQMAELMKSYGVKTAYNLDGGGSSTLYFNGQVINKPTTNGTIKERAVSDIVYIGY